MDNLYLIPKKVMENGEIRSFLASECTMSINLPILQSLAKHMVAYTHRLRTLYECRPWIVLISCAG